MAQYTDEQETLLAQAQRDLNKAQQVRQLLENPMLVEALAEIERKWAEAWRKSVPSDVEGREKAYRILLALDEFYAELQTHLESGRLAEETTASLRGDRVGSRSPDIEFEDD